MTLICSHIERYRLPHRLKERVQSWVQACIPSADMRHFARATVRALNIGLIFCAVGLSKPVLAGGREEAVLEALGQLRDDSRRDAGARLHDLHSSYLNSTVVTERREHMLLSVGLGASYIETNPRLALQYLSSAELACREDDRLSPIIKYYMAEARFHAGAYTESVAMIAELLSGKGRMQADGWVKRLQSLYIEGLYATGDFERLIDVFKTFSEHYSFSQRQEQLARMAITALEKNASTAEATELLETLARGYPATVESRWAFTKLQDYTCGTPRHGRYYFSEKLLLSLSRNILLNTGLEEFLVGAVERPLVDEKGNIRTLSTAEKADFFFHAHMYRQALKALEAIYGEEKTKTDKGALSALTFEIGRTHLRLNEPMVATRYFSDFIYNYPKHPLVTRALEYLGDALRYENEPLAAAQNYAEALRRKDSETLRWMYFWSLYRGKDYNGALALLATPGYVTPREGDDALVVRYWHARILELLGRKPEAMRIYSEILNTEGSSFYSVLTASRHPELVSGTPSITGADAPTEVQGDLGAAPLIASLPIAASLGTDDTGANLAGKMLLKGTAPSPSGAAPIRPDLRLIDDLVRVGLFDAAGIELAGVKWSGFDDRESFASFARLASALNDYRPTRNLRNATFSTLKNLPRNFGEMLQHQGAHADEWKLYYPLAFERLVLPVSARMRMNPFFVMSIMRTESYYNRDARSGVGAQGLMQLMPYTALKIATLIGDDRFDVRELTKPATNISYGTYYLDRLLRYYEDNPFLAAAAYNGGPQVVNQWLDSCRNCEADAFVDAIPYRETRRYVRDVIRNYAQYAQIYTGRAAFPQLPAMPTQPPSGEEIF